MASLQDQLLKAGIVDSKKAKAINKEQRKEARQHPKGGAKTNETKALAAQALANKAERDRQLNKQRQEAVDKKALQAQIRQLIHLNRISRDGGDTAYNFSDGKKIKKIYINTTLQTQLSKGQLAIAKLDEGYELVPAAVAEKIRQRDEATIILLNSSSSNEGDEVDPYADYQIPDDLMW